MRLGALCLLAILFAGALAPAGATTARLRSLGGQGDYLEDDANVLRWYGSLVDYPGRAVLELGTWDHEAPGPLSDRIGGRGGGLHARFDRAGRWGTGAVYFGEDLPAPDLGGWIQLLWARRLGPLAVGASFRGSSYSEAGRTTGSDALDGQSAFTHGLGLGVRWDLADGLYADLAADLRHVDVDYLRGSTGPTVSGVGGWDGLGARARLFQELKRELALVYRAEWLRDRRPLVDAIMADLVDLDLDVLRGGVGCLYLPDADNLLIVSVDYHRIDETRRARHPFFADFTHGERAWWRLDVRCGLEARLLPWLTARAAAGYRRTVDEAQLVHDWSDGFQERVYGYAVRVRTPVVLGLGLHAGPFDADLVLNDTAPWGLDHAGPVADDDRAGGFSAITLAYRF
jgi:hypothetical protein